MQAQKLVNSPKQMYTILIVSVLVVLIFSQTPVCAKNSPPSNFNNGPYIDKIVYKVISDSDQRFLALQAGEIEMDCEFLNPLHLPTLGDPDIDFFSALRNGYGHITINCRYYPLNISGLRRAFAYAFDKSSVRDDIFGGFSQNHDSLVPLPNGWCIEDKLDWHYYDDRADIGNQILDDLGFEINATSGFRHAPNGEPFDIVIRYSTSSQEIAGGVAQIGVNALHALHIDADIGVSDYIEYDPDILDYYDMSCYATNFYSNDVDWLAYDYWSGNANNSDLNPTHFANATYDSWRDQLLYGTTYEKVYEAAAEMQKILHYNVPRLVVYENTYIQGYRNDKFAGHVEDLGRYITGPWTMRIIHKLDGSPGGTVPVAMGGEPDTFNIFLTNSQWSGAILTELYSSLYTFGPDLNPWPDLATNMLTETHADNVAVPSGHTRFTIDIVQNATWSDGVPLTANDVIFSYTYALESVLYGNPVGLHLVDMVAAYAPTLYKVVVEFNTESYWHFSNFAYHSIIPEHIFNNEDGIGYEGWETWNPVFNPSHPHVTSGPFLLTDYEAGEHYELTSNPTYHYRVSKHAPQIAQVGDISYQVGTIGHEITWFTEDDDPDTYQITMNGTIRESGDLTSNNISHNIDGLPIGNYSFTLTVFDQTGYTSMSTTNVFVLALPSGTTTWDPLIALLVASVSSGSVVIILLSISAIYRTKRLQTSTKVQRFNRNSKSCHVS